MCAISRGIAPEAGGLRSFAIGGYTITWNKNGKGGENMQAKQYDHVCNWTERREEHLPLRNLKSGQIGYSFGCTYEGETIQVRLENGELDSWERKDCEEATTH